jgi:hypothetical protein
MIKTIRMRYKVNKFSSVKENDRTGLRYAHEEDNPYAEVSSKIQELVSDSNDGLWCNFCIESNSVRKYTSGLNE